MENSTTIPIRCEDYFYLARYRDGSVVRWLVHLGPDYRGGEIEPVPEDELPKPVLKRFYG